MISTGRPRSHLNRRISYTGNPEIPGAMLKRRLSLAQWRLIRVFVGPRYLTYFMAPFWCVELASGSWTFGKIWTIFLHECLVRCTVYHATRHGNADVESVHTHEIPFSQCTIAHGVYIQINMVRCLLGQNAECD